MQVSMKQILLIAIVVSGFTACAKKTTSGAGSTTITPTAMKMYETDVRPIVESKCTPCHIPSKGGMKGALDNAEAAKKHIDDMIRRVQLSPNDHDYMPFKGKKDPLTEQEIAQLKAWKASL